MTGSLYFTPGPLSQKPNLIPSGIKLGLRNAIPGPVKFPVNRPGKLSGPVVTRSFEKRAPGPAFYDTAHGPDFFPAQLRY